MLRFLTAAMLLAGAAFAGTTTGASSVTFNKDVLPILQKNCQTCHRPGEIGPMAFLNYEGTRPWAKSIKQAVLTKQMPPWFADPRYGHFSNERKLSDADIKTVVAWVDAGAPEGNAKDMPTPMVWTEGWNIKPDVTFQLPKPYTVPKTGTIQYTYFIVPSGLTKDTWVTDAEVRAGNRSVVHHASVYIRPPGSAWLKDAPIGEAYVAPARGPLGTHPPSEIASSQAKMDNEWFVGYVPGIQPQRYFAPETGAAKLIPAGSDIVFEMHYTANGKEEGVDQTKVGFVLAKEAPKYRLLDDWCGECRFRDSSGRSQLRRPRQCDVQRTCHRDLSAAPHAHARQGHGDSLPISDGRIPNHAECAALQLFVADHLLRAKTAPGAEGYQGGCNRALG